VANSWTPMPWDQADAKPSIQRAKQKLREAAQAAGEADLPTPVSPLPSPSSPASPSPKPRAAPSLPTPLASDDPLLRAAREGAASGAALHRAKVEAAARRTAEGDAAKRAEADAEAALPLWERTPLTTAEMQQAEAKRRRAALDLAGRVAQDMGLL